MAIAHRGFWLFAAVGLLVVACGGDDSSTSSGTYSSGGSGGSGTTGGAGGTGGATSGGTGGTGGEMDAGGSGGTAGAPEGGTSSDAASDAASDATAHCLASGTINVTNEDSTGYIFDGSPINPTLTLCRGNTYTFAVNTPGHPFYIRQQNGSSYTPGVTGAHTAMGNVVFAVPSDAPAMLFYQCDVHEVMTGPLVIVD